MNGALSAGGEPDESAHLAPSGGGSTEGEGRSKVPEVDIIDPKAAGDNTVDTVSQTGDDDSAQLLSTWYSWINYKSVTKIWYSLTPFLSRKAKMKEKCCWYILRCHWYGRTVKHSKELTSVTFTFRRWEWTISGQGTFKFCLVNVAVLYLGATRNHLQIFPYIWFRESYARSGCKTQCSSVVPLSYGLLLWTIFWPQKGDNRVDVYQEKLFSSRKGIVENIMGLWQIDPVREFCHNIFFCKCLALLCFSNSPFYVFYPYLTLHHFTKIAPVC